MPPQTPNEKKYAAVKKELLSSSKLLDELAVSPYRRLNSEDLLERIVHHFGGTNAFAYEIVSLYKETTSVMARQRIMDMVARLFMSQTPLEPGLGVETMDTEDLQLVLHDTLTRMGHERILPATRQALPPPEGPADPAGPAAG